MDLLKGVNITKRFSNHTALDNLNITVPEGCIYGILGPNGAGKTTFLRIINYITIPDEGEIFYKGKKLSSLHSSLIGYLPEERGLYKKMKVGEQALYLAQLKGISRKDALEKLKYWFEKFGIREWWNRKVEELSKGMQQKVQFIITILHEPELVIFDEPFSGFDPINVNILKDEIFNLKKKGSTIIFSTHNMGSVEELCDSIILLNKSKKVLEGEVKRIKKDFKSNVYEIEYEDNGTKVEDFLDRSYRITEVCQDIFDAENHKMRSLRIKIPQEGTANILLEQFIQKVPVHSFKEILPTMNDIFIKMVKGN